MLQRFLILWLVLLSAVALWWSGLFPGAFDPFVRSRPLLPWLIAATMFAIGMMLPLDEVQQVIRRWPMVLCGTALQYTTMPALAYLVGVLWGFQGSDLIGVIMVGCVPGAMASNVLTLNARGNTSYSVSLTTTATLLSPIAVPLVLAITLSSEEGVGLDPLDTSRKLLLTVVLPVVCGHLLTRRFPTCERWAGKAGSTVANLAILWIIAAVVGLNRGPLASFRFDILWALAAINAGGYSIGYAGGWMLRLPEGMRRALALEIGMQNAGLGSVLALEFFPDQTEIAIAPATYTFGCMLTGTVLASFWALSATPAKSHSPGVESASE